MKDLTRRHLLLSEEEKEFIRNEYYYINMKDLAIFLRRDVNTINSFIKHENLGWIGKYKQQATQRKKGYIPHNKGQKMKPEVYERIKHTLFAKGSKPHNTKKELHKEKHADGYWYIKISDNNWELLHRYNWEQKHGKIEKGLLLVFKDNNVDNCEVDNLELITKSENMLRNSRHKYSREIIPTKLLINEIKKKINEQSS